MGSDRFFSTKGDPWISLSDYYKFEIMYAEESVHSSEKIFGGYGANEHNIILSNHKGMDVYIMNPKENNENAGKVVGIIFGVLGGIWMVCCCYPCCLKKRKPLPAGHDAVGPADDGWGPYKCILAVRDGGRELIPGKLATSKNMAFFSYGGKEHQTGDYKIVKGTVLAKG